MIFCMFVDLKIRYHIVHNIYINQYYLLIKK